MRILSLHIKTQFKNLKDFKIEFDENKETSVLIGHNGTGKSNLIEAIVLIFRNIDLNIEPEFDYYIKYKISDNIIEIDVENRKFKLVTTNDLKNNIKMISDDINKGIYYPKNIFTYYSGPTNRLEKYFDKHQKKFYDKLIKFGSENKELPLRPLFYARLIHSQFVMLSFFSFEDKKTNNFLKEYFNIEDLESVLFTIKEPPWKIKDKKNKHYWGAEGVVKKFLENLYENSLAPIFTSEKIKLSYKKNPVDREVIYFFLKDKKALQKLIKDYNDNIEFFKMLESTYISELIKEVKIKVKKFDGSKITFSELSEGEQQLLVVLGLLKFNDNEESLFLLDEPDTHLNPAWKFKYYKLLKEILNENNRKNNHIIMNTHDPLVIGGLLKEEVRILSKNKKLENKIEVHEPEIDPKGMGVAALLTSELFGLRSTLDEDTQKLLDDKRELYVKLLNNNINEEEKKKFEELTKKLGELDYNKTTRDPLYDKFIKAIFNREEFRKPVVTPEERERMDEIADEIINEILKESE